MEGEGARVLQVERTASVGALRGDTITPVLETMEKKTAVCLEQGMGAVMYV